MFRQLLQSGIFFMIIASLFFSIMGALVKFTTERVPYMEAVFFRAFVMLVLLTPYMTWKKIPFFSHQPWLMLIRVTSGFIALCMTFYVTSKIELANTSILNRTSIIFVAIFSALFLREKVTTTLMVYIIAAMVGACLIIKPNLEVLNLPGLIGLISGVFAAIAYISIKKLHQTDHFFTMVFNFALFGSLIPPIISGHSFIWPTPLEWLAFIGIGTVATIAQLSMTYAYKYTEASIVSPYSFATVMFSALWGVLFWGEIPDYWSLLGGVLIIVCGIGIMKLKKSRGETAIEVEEDWAEQGEAK